MSFYIYIFSVFSILVFLSFTHKTPVDKIDFIVFKFHLRFDLNIALKIVTNREFCWKVNIYQFSIYIINGINILRAN